MFGLKSRNPLLSGFVLGAVLGDVVTWVGISMFELPRHAREVTIDAIVNVLSLAALFLFAGLEIPRDEDRMLAAFFAFIVVAVTKAFLYILERFLGDAE